MKHDPATDPRGFEWIFLKDGKEVFRLFLMFGSKPGLPDGLLPRNAR